MVFIDPFHLIMQTDIVTNSVNSAVIIATALGTIVSIVMTILNRLGVLQTNKGVKSALDYTKEVSDHVVQSKADILTLADVTYKMLPAEAQKIADAQNIKIVELNKKLQEAQEQLQRAAPIIGTIGGATGAASISRPKAATVQLQLMPDGTTAKILDSKESPPATSAN